MAVASSNNALQPTGIKGPPEIMVGQTSLVGDVSGGNFTISFALPPGFLYMPQFVSVATSAGTPDILYQLIGTDEAVGSSVRTWSVSQALPTLGVDTIVVPRMLIRTVTFAGQIGISTPNVDGVTQIMYVRILRWEKNFGPEAWLAFWTAPP